MQALGRFTVKWVQKGTIQYGCWFSSSPHYFKCINGIRSIQMESRDGDRGVLLRDDYWYFPPSVTIDPATLATFLALPTPFFVREYIENDEALTSSGTTVYKEIPTATPRTPSISYPEGL